MNHYPKNRTEKPDNPQRGKELAPRGIYCLTTGGFPDILNLSWDRVLHANTSLTTQCAGSRPYGQPGQLPKDEKPGRVFSLGGKSRRAGRSSLLIELKAQFYKLVTL